MKEAAARIKINKLLENAGWRFFTDANGPANIQLEPSVTVKTQDLDALGENFEKSSKGFIDFLLLNEKSFPFIVLEAKAEDKSPLVGKEQARKYAKSQNCRFVILPTAICITSGTSNAETRMSSRHSRLRHPSPGTKRTRPTRNV
jgi:type I restriction enzyme R subunit